MYVPTAVIRPQLNVMARATVPTQFGRFDMHVFRYGTRAATFTNPKSQGGDGDGRDEHDLGLSPDHVALTVGDLTGDEPVLARVHSECLTSEVFGSLKCDCREQLQAAQKRIAKEGRGVVLYMRQEGRGIGLVNKIRAYDLQDRGHDTVDANRMLGLPDDARDYSGAAAMLAHLGVQSVRLMTNNPEKVIAMARRGVLVDRREPMLVATNPLAEDYLETKRRRMGHRVPPKLAENSAE